MQLLYHQSQLLVYHLPSVFPLSNKPELISCIIDNIAFPTASPIAFTNPVFSNGTTASPICAIVGELIIAPRASFGILGY